MQFWVLNSTYKREDFLRDFGSETENNGHIFTGVEVEGKPEKKRFFRTKILMTIPGFTCIPGHTKKLIISGS